MALIMLLASLRFEDIQWRRQLWGTGARAPSPSTSNSFIFLVYSGVNLTANYLSIV